MIDVWEFYDNGECVQSLDMSDYQCLAIRGGEPINEACGGCVGCLLAQATYSAEYNEIGERIEGEKRITKLEYKSAR